MAARVHGARAQRDRRGRLVWAGWAWPLLLAGCQAAQPREPQPPVPANANADLVAYISNQAYVTAEPGYRAVYILAKGEPYAGEFAELTAAMESEKLIGGGWKLAADTPLDRAAVGFMLCRACDIKTGINWNLTGLGRYAWRELLYHQIAQGGSEFGLMSGGEFVGTLMRADEYLARTRRRGAETTELGPRPK